MKVVLHSPIFWSTSLPYSCSFWLLIRVFSDLFRRHDVSGWGKVLWVVLLIALPYIGIFESSWKVRVCLSEMKRMSNKPEPIYVRSWASALPTRPKSLAG